jgi:regulator of protease activity HflC (stomatin/prohibitin superfamily)
MKRSNLLTTAIFVFAAFILLLFLTSGMFITIDAGHKAVLFRKFGGGLDKERIYDQGFHVVAPWNTLIEYEVRLQSRDETLDVLTRNGLTVNIDLSFRYQPSLTRIGYLHDELGQDYLNRVLIPVIRSVTRQVIGKYTPEELYAEKRNQIEAEIFEMSRKQLDGKNVELDAILIRSVVLPNTIKDAIERKLRQEQESQEYDFRIEKERKEAERKRIEANGIREYQNIVNQSLSEQLLRWQGIEATKELANSQNSKVIVVGSGKDGLPLILGGN